MKIIAARDSDCMLDGLWRQAALMRVYDIVVPEAGCMLRDRCRRASAIAVLALCAAIATAQPLPSTHVDDFAGKPRVVVISDIGNEPDDQMSFVRLLLYSNEFDIEALVAATSTWQK